MLTIAFFFSVDFPPSITEKGFQSINVNWMTLIRFSHFQKWRLIITNRTSQCGNLEIGSYLNKCCYQNTWLGCKCNQLHLDHSYRCNHCLNMIKFTMILKLGKCKKNLIWKGTFWNPFPPSSHFKIISYHLDINLRESSQIDWLEKPFCRFLHYSHHHQSKRIENELYLKVYWEIVFLMRQCLTGAAHR